MFKRAAHILAVTLLFATSVIPVIHGFSVGSNPASSKPAVVAVSGGDPEPTSPNVVHRILALLGLA
jgi:hypothetical protein